MLKGHPKGLYVAFLTNMGERFGFYTMMAILLLFLQAKFNLPPTKASLVISVFLFLIYALALVGGFIADRTQNYKGVVATGVIVMFAGYLLLAIPGMGFPVAVIGLLAISFGNGLFKGNLQALVGQMYDDPQYSSLRDTAYSIFYMGINIGAVFAPTAATAIQKWWMNTKKFTYDADLPSLCNQFVQGKEAFLTNSKLTETDWQTALDKLGDLATKVSDSAVTDLGGFAKNYLEALSTGYNYAFGIASIAMLISLTCYIIFKRHLPEKKHVAAGGSAAVPQMDKTEEKKRLTALLFVFLVVIFFWMSFHQNNLTMTLFARDYTVKSVSSLNNLLFNIWSLLSIGLAAAGLVFALKPSSTGRERSIGAAVAIVFGALVYYFYNIFCTNPNSQAINPAIFQQFNPFFVVFLTPVIVGLFAWLRARKKEPSAPRKIGIGMIIAALGFVVLMVGSFGLPSQASLAGSPVPETARVSSQWLISSYLVLTFAELCLSPMGISFVSKVAPPRFQGLMQGCWLGATAIGNQLIFVGGFFWTRVPVWGVWAIFIACCLISAVVMFSLLKRIERVTS